MAKLLNTLAVFSTGFILAAISLNLPLKVGSTDSQQNKVNQANIFTLPDSQTNKTQSESFLHTIKVTVTRLEDIKVKEKQLVKPGDVISDSSFERSPLLAKKRQLEIAIAKASLPLTDTEQMLKAQFEQDTMALQKAQLDLKKVTEQIKNYPGLVFKDLEFSEIFEPEKVKEVAALKEKQIGATLAVKEAVSRLNAAQIQHSIQLSTHETNLYKQKYELESLTGQLQEVNEQLKEIVAIRSPYEGYVYRVRITGQNDRNLAAEITLEVKR